MARKSQESAAVATPSPTESLDPNRLMAQLPIRPYEKVLDAGCGSGHFTIPLAKFLFDGKVYAMDSTAANLNRLTEKLPKTHLGNVEIITTKRQQQAIPAGSLDGALLPFILHQSADKEGLLKDLLKPLKRGAWVGVLEWQKKASPEGPPESQRLSEADVVALAEGVGFRFNGKRDMTSRYYLLLLRR